MEFLVAKFYKGHFFGGIMSEELLRVFRFTRVSLPKNNYDKLELLRGYQERKEVVLIRDALESQNQIVRTAGLVFCALNNELPYTYYLSFIKDGTRASKQYDVRNLLELSIGNAL